jgi:hypothetical protein
LLDRTGASRLSFVQSRKQILILTSWGKQSISYLPFSHIIFHSRSKTPLLKENKKKEERKKEKEREIATIDQTQSLQDRTRVSTVEIMVGRQQLSLYLSFSVATLTTAVTRQAVTSRHVLRHSM